MQLQDYVNDIQEMLHDTTATSWPISRVISRTNEARLDAARDCQCIRYNVVGIQLIQGVEIYNLQGAVAGATVATGGSNYGTGSTVPVTFTPAPAGGITATAIGNLVSGSLGSITMTRWGVGYTQPPTISIGGIGSGATATPVVLFMSNPLSSLIGNPLVVNDISFTWNNERRSMKYLNWRLFQAYARLWANTFLAPPGVWTNLQTQNALYGGTVGGLGFTSSISQIGQLSLASFSQSGGQVLIQPPPDQQYVSEWEIIFQPAPLVALSDNDNQVVDPWQRAVQFRAAENLLIKHQNWGMVNAFGQRYDAYVPRIINTSGGVRIPNIYNRNFQRRVMR